MINGDRYFVSYEGLTNIRSGCGMYGHLIHNCPLVGKKRALVVRAKEMKEKTDEAPRVNDKFTVVRRSGRSSAVAPNKAVSAAEVRVRSSKKIRIKSRVLRKRKRLRLQTDLEV